ncbi:MAG TPA: O-antigen ligase family protein, partial [Chitinophagaceae bacterium]|nr:O-antigen ligase family protein [Chitinophagaceae bacterium]
MRNKLQNDPIAPDTYRDRWKHTIIFILVIIMMASFFFSRALLSLTMMVFVLFCFFHRDIKSHIRNFFSSPLLWSMSLLFFLPLLSGLWSEDKKEWLDIVRIKLPLLFLPLAFAGPPDSYRDQFSKKQWEWLAFIFIALVTAGTVWSMFHYVTNMTAVHEEYLHAKTMITPLINDHVRFSWVVSVSVFLSAWFLFLKRKENKLVAWVLLMITLWLILFLHILAARTGLLSFYLFIFFIIFWLIFKKAKPLYAIILFAIVISLPLAAYFLLPTFQNRVKYFLHSQAYFKDAHYLQGSNDAIRVISLKAGWNIMNEHPVKGVGFGDVLAETKKWYNIHYPQMIEEEKIYPGSEWIMYGVGCGWPGLLVFAFVMIIPFLLSVKN